MNFSYHDTYFKQHILVYACKNCMLNQLNQININHIKTFLL